MNAISVSSLVDLCNNLFNTDNSFFEKVGKSRFLLYCFALLFLTNHSIYDSNLYRFTYRHFIFYVKAESGDLGVDRYYIGTINASNYMIYEKGANIYIRIENYVANI